MNTYLALCQVLGIHDQDKIPIGLMMMAMRIQNPETNIEYDFASYFEKALDDEFSQVIEDRAPITFRHYSLLCHLILY